MTISFAALLAVLLGLQIKHLLFDFTFQSNWQVTNKGTYGHPGGIVHAGLHAIGTWIVFSAAAFFDLLSFTFALMLAVAEFLIHYHVDWSKSQISQRLNLQPAHRSYWFAFGADQATHQLTYLGLVAAWLFI